MTSQAIEVTFIHEGLKQMRLFSSPKHNLGTPLLYELGCYPLTPLGLIFLMPIHVLFMVRVDLSWSFLWLGLLGPVLVLFILHFKLFSYLSWLFLFFFLRA